MSVYKIIQEIKKTRSRNTKEEILAREVDNEDLKKFFHLALSPFINFYQKKAFTQVTTGDANLSMVMDALYDKIALRVYTGGSATQYINDLINTLSKDDAKVIMHILQKESGCDLGGATINKIWPKLVPEYPSLLATAYTDKLAEKLNWAKGVFSQTKSDGGRVAIEVTNDGAVSVISRAGNELNVFGIFDFLGEHFKGFVIDGELLNIEPSGRFSSRQKSNGIFTKCVRGTLSEEESQSLHVTVWDLIPLTDFKRESCQLEYSFRFGQLATKVAPLSKVKISLIPSRIVHSLAQAQEHYQEMLAAKEEGTMLKDQDMLWENKRSKKQLKLKANETGDMKVTGYKPGVGKFTGTLGSLDIASSDDRVVANMSGFSFKVRAEIFANLVKKPITYTMIEDDAEVEYTANPGDSCIDIGSIVEVYYNQKVQSRDSDVWSLFLPRFKQSRPDKTVANSFDELK